MVDLHVVEHHALAAHHIVVVIGGEVRVEAVGGLGTLAVADVVGQDEEILRDVERLAGAEEHIREQGVQQRVGTAAGAMEQEHGIIDVAGGVAVGRAEGEVVQLELRQRLSGAEAEVCQHDGAIDRGPSVSRRLSSRWGIGRGERHGLAIGNGADQEGRRQVNPTCAQVHARVPHVFDLSTAPLALFVRIAHVLGRFASKAVGFGLGPTLT
jgi:hypothetical protein